MTDSKVWLITGSSTGFGRSLTEAVMTIVELIAHRSIGEDAVNLRKTKL